MSLQYCTPLRPLILNFFVAHLHSYSVLQGNLWCFINKRLPLTVYLKNLGDSSRLIPNLELHQWRHLVTASSSSPDSTFLALHSGWTRGFSSTSLVWSRGGSSLPPSGTGGPDDPDNPQPTRSRSSGTRRGAPPTGTGGSGSSGSGAAQLNCPKCGDPCTHVETFVCEWSPKWTSCISLLLVWPIDNRCEDARFPVPVSCVTILNSDSIFTSERVVNSGIRSWKKHWPEWAQYKKAIGDLRITNKWRAETLQPGLDFDNFKPLLTGKHLHGSFLRLMMCASNFVVVRLDL